VIRLSLAEVASAVDGRLVGADPQAAVTGTVEFDSRRAGPGALFVAFPGAKVDGHDFASAAVAAGAVAVLGTRPVDGVPMIIVADALTAMGRLARAVRDRLPALTVVGITGSSGKTTTKDLTAQLLPAVFQGAEVVAPPGSFNNELGLPHTVLQADERTRFLVLEMGSRGPGHIRYLCGIARPDVGVVVNVGVAHIGEFGSVDGIAVAKGELVEALPAGGFAVLNADDERVRAMAGRTAARVVLAGEAADAAVRATDVTLDERGRPAYRLTGPGGQADVRLAVAGRHQVGNSLLAAAVAVSLGAAVPDVAAALGDLRLVSGRRMDVFDRADGVMVVDDSYNANPASTAVALRALTAMGRGRRTVAVLGYLAELGDHERAGHEEVGRLAAELGVDLLVVVGEPAAPICAGAAAVASWGGKSVLVTDQPAAVALLRDELRPGDVVLVKGSRYRTWDVVDALRDEAGAGV
jgi:UDP-N-acetylmuramoyl-tripeptide--D-alanyl-D-alanine ligase